MNVLKTEKHPPLACDEYSDVCSVCTVTYCTSLFFCVFVPSLSVLQLCFSVYNGGGVDPGVYFCLLHYLSSCTLMCA